MYSKKQQLKHNKKPRKKRCKECEELFAPIRDMQPCCSYSCEVMYVVKNLNSLIDDGKKRDIKKSNKLKKAFNQTDKSYMMNKAQYTFNKFIRLRDINKQCVSCYFVWGLKGHQRQSQASHYMSVGKSKILRFNEDNVHKSCQICNSHLSGNLVEYRIRLIKIIGLKRVEELELISKSSKPCRYSIDDYKDIIVKYNLKIKELEL